MLLLLLLLLLLSMMLMLQELVTVRIGVGRVFGSFCAALLQWLQQPAGAAAGQLHYKLQQLLSLQSQHQQIQHRLLQQQQPGSSQQQPHQQPHQTQQLQQQAQEVEQQMHVLLQDCNSLAAVNPKPRLVDFACIVPKSSPITPAAA